MSHDRMIIQTTKSFKIECSSSKVKYKGKYPQNNSTMETKIVKFLLYNKEESSSLPNHTEDKEILPYKFFG